MIRSSCDLSVELSVARSSKRQVVRLSGFSEDARLVTDGTGSAGMAGTRHRGRKPKVWSVRISDIRPRILLLQAMNGRFGEAAPQRKNALERQLGAGNAPCRWGRLRPVTVRFLHFACGVAMVGSVSLLSSGIWLGAS